VAPFPDMSFVGTKLRVTREPRLPWNSLGNTVSRRPARQILATCVIAHSAAKHVVSYRREAHRNAPVSLEAPGMDFVLAKLDPQVFPDLW
jgi:hypothetical protein